MEEIYLEDKEFDLFVRMKLILNWLIVGRSISDIVGSLYCDNKFDNLLRINGRSVKCEKIIGPL